MRREAGRSTLTGIAAQAGVSVSTVSKVLNGRTDVAPGTRDRITKLLRGHGYQLVPGLRFGVADLMIGSLHGPWAEELIRGAVDAARAEDAAGVAGAALAEALISRAAAGTARMARAGRRGSLLRKASGLS